MGDNDFLWGFGGFLAGALLASQDDVYKQYKKDLPQFMEFLRKRKQFEE